MSHRLVFDAKLEVRLIGAQRSGNNAVISWMLKCLDDYVLKATNCSFASQEHQQLFLPRDYGTGLVLRPTITRSALAANSWHLYGKASRVLARGSAKRKLVDGELDDAAWVSANEDRRWDARLDAIVGRGPVAALAHFDQLYDTGRQILALPGIPRQLGAVVFHLEDFDPSELDAVPWDASPMSVRSTHCIHLVVQRDFPNWIASRIKSGRNADEAAVKIWLSTARLYADTPRPHRGGELHFVNYNRWLADEPYRNALAGHLRVVDRGLSDQVLVAGGGSSFDGIGGGGAGLRHQVMDRPARLNEAERSRFDEVMASAPEAVRMSRELFDLR